MRFMPGEMTRGLLHVTRTNLCEITAVSFFFPSTFCSCQRSVLGFPPGVTMWFYAALVIGAVALVIYIVVSLRPSTNNNGGSIDLFFEDADDEKDAIARAAREAEEIQRYTKTFTEPGKQVLVLYGTEYSFSGEVARKLFDNLMKMEGVQPRLINMKDYNGMCDLLKEQVRNNFHLNENKIKPELIHFLVILACPGDLFHDRRWRPAH